MQTLQDLIDFLSRDLQGAGRSIGNAVNPPQYAGTMGTHPMFDPPRMYTGTEAMPQQKPPDMWSPEGWDSFKAMILGRQPQLAQWGTGQLGGPIEDLASLFAPKQPPQPPVQFVGPAGMPPGRQQQGPFMSSVGRAQPSVNWLTPTPEITDMGRLREQAADQWSQRSPGYPLNNVDPYADDPFARLR